MANRFIDTSFYKSPFIRGLKGSLKGLYSFIICDCNGAGIWAADFEIASVYTGFNITKKEFEESFILCGKSIDLGGGKYFFPDFIEHQYPKGLSGNNPAHNNIIIELKKFGLIDENLKPLRSTFEGTKVMVKEKVMVKVKEKVEVMVIEKKDLNFPYESENFKKTWEILVNSKKWKKKPFTALQASLKKLGNESYQDAIKMMENAIAGDWMGLFELKPHEKFNYGKQNNQKSRHSGAISVGQSALTELKAIEDRNRNSGS